MFKEEPVRSNQIISKPWKCFYNTIFYSDFIWYDKIINYKCNYYIKKKKT